MSRLRIWRGYVANIAALAGRIVIGGNPTGDSTAVTGDSTLYTGDMT